MSKVSVRETEGTTTVCICRVNQIKRRSSLSGRNCLEATPGRGWLARRRQVSDSACHPTTSLCVLAESSRISQRQGEQEGQGTATRKQGS